MAFVNYNNKEITVKIVYYGPALSGKTTCLQYIYDSGEYRKKGKLITLDTDGDRTLFFDFLPIEIGKLGDYSIKMQLYTVPGQVAYNTTRKLVLQGSDGIVFVADSQVVMREQNVDSFNNLKENLKANNISYEETPLIFQYNKRDLRELLPIDILNKDLNPENKAFFPTVGTTGENILEGLHTIMKIVIIHLKNKLSIFQKDKTVMFSRDEITDSIAKKSKTQPAPAPTPTPQTRIQPPPPQAPQEKARPKPEPKFEPKFEPKPTPKPAPAPAPKSRPESIFPGVESSRGRDLEVEKEEIFELSSPLIDEPVKKKDFPSAGKSRIHEPEEEDIFNLGDESRFVGDGADFDVPEVVIKDELGIDEIKGETSPNVVSSAPNYARSRSGEKPGTIAPPLPVDEEEEISSEYQLQSRDMLPSVSPVTKAGGNESQGVTRMPRGTEIPITIEVPEDKDEITIHLNLRIVIKKK